MMASLNNDATMAFKAGRKFKCGDAEIEISSWGRVTMKFHDLPIAILDRSRSGTFLWLSMRGRTACDTLSLINAICASFDLPDYFRQNNSSTQQYFGDMPIQADDTLLFTITSDGVSLDKIESRKEKQDKNKRDD